MWNTASIAEMLHESKGYGFDVSVKGFDWETLKKKRDAYIVRLNGIYINNLNKDGVHHITGTASFLDKNTVVVNGEKLTSKHILIATGSQAYFPDAPGAREHGANMFAIFSTQLYL
jgi:glutathione reductase (NADPH)